MLMAFCVVAVMGSSTRGEETFERFFRDQTLRVDLYHSGTKGSESFSLDRSLLEGAWPGSRVNLIDTMNLGEYQFRVYDRATGRLVYSRGYSTIFNEWQTTDEAASGTQRTFSESVRFPLPRRAIQLTIARRQKNMIFRELSSIIIDPADPTQISKSIPGSQYKVRGLMDNGDPAEKVDIVVIGDGYSREDQKKFHDDGEHFTRVLFETEPFSSRKDDFNVWTVAVESPESGIDVPDKDVWKGNPLGCMYNTFGSARYVLTTENEALRDAAAAAPYDFICILVNDTRYGGGGIYNLYATTYTREENEGQKWQMDYVYVHEFGHSFGGLGDEYYSSSTGYNEFYPSGVEPWEPNVTALLDKENVKWGHLLSEGMTIPTPWEKSLYDSLEAIRGKLDRLAPDYYEKRAPLHKKAMETLSTSRYAGKVGVFEGAGYVSKGLYRPAVNCRMFSLSLTDFDPVCSAAIERMIDFYSK
jgi:hypothetical protein